LLALGIELEGHPDNVAASLYGGCTLCVPAAAGPVVLSIDVARELAFALAWPDVAVETGRARAVLPASVPLADAVENARRLPLLVEGLRTGRADLLRVGGSDRLHEQHRLPLIPGGAAALAAARDAGAHLAVVSGSGSALIALCERERAEEIAAAMRVELEARSGNARARVASAVRTPPTAREAASL
jgi:homoserine kinase